MSRKNDIAALLEEISNIYSEIESGYNQALKDKDISLKLKIKIKSFFDNSRSVLDYLAHDIAEKSGVQCTRIYFPIVKSDADIESYKGFIGRHLPDLQDKSKMIFDYFESIQPYQNNQNWLADFADICNNNKHQSLTPQKKEETVRIKSTHTGGGSVSWNPSSVSFGSGVYINGAPVNPHSQMPINTPETTITKEIWVDFLFDRNINALALIKKVKGEFPKIISKAYKILER